MRCLLAGLLLAAACVRDEGALPRGEGTTANSDAPSDTSASESGTAGGAPSAGSDVSSGPSVAESSTGQVHGETGASTTSTGTDGVGAGSSGSTGTSTGEVESVPEPVFELATGLVGLSMGHVGPAEPQFPPGIGWRDMNGDGHVDLLLSSFDGGSRLWLGDGAGAFSDAAPMVVAGGFPATGVAIGDYDNDGAPDAYLSGLGSSALLNGGSGLSELADSAGVGDPNDGTVGAWGDFDGDGDLDLYSGAWDAEGLTNSSRLYENLGDGTFNEVTSVLDPGLVGRPVLAASFLDFDNDGDSDIYVVVDKEHGNILWQNDGPGCGGWCFQDVTVYT